MENEDKYAIQDLLTAAVEQKPLDFEDAFSNLITDRIRAAVEDRKVQIAQSLYNYEPPEQDFEEPGEFDAGEENSEEE